MRDRDEVVGSSSVKWMQWEGNPDNPEPDARARVIVCFTSGVEYLYSTASPGGSMTVVRFKVGTDLETALVRLNQKLQTNFDHIPLGVSAPLIKPRTIDDVPVDLWMGWSNGRWEGDTLVVDTTNFTGKYSFRGSDQNLHLIERFTRTGANTINYEFTIDDPTAFTKPWTAQLPMQAIDGLVYEYACHEGNYGMTGALKGARVEEKKAAEAAAKPWIDALEAQRASTRAAQAAGTP